MKLKDILPFLLIDDQHKHLLTEYTWHPIKARSNTNKYYLVTRFNNKTIYLHRLILNAQKGQIVDHINRNTLDNRISNLRFVSASLNRYNSNTNKSLPTRIRATKSGKYTACITIKGKQKWLGTFPTIEKATEVYQKNLKSII